MAKRSSKTKKKVEDKTTLFTDEATLRALSSPLRMEILQAFSPEGRLTVAELAERLSRPRGSLYYHVRKLTKIGVLVEVEQRPVGRKYESVYEIVSDRIAIGSDPSSGQGNKALAKLVASMLRQTGREFEVALQQNLFEGREGAQMGRRQRAWLTDRDLEKIEDLLDRVEEICMKASERKEGRLYSVTSLVVPLPK